MKKSVDFFILLVLVMFLFIGFFRPQTSSWLMAPAEEFSAGGTEKEAMTKSFRWTEANGNPLEVTFTLPQLLLQESLDAFGVHPSRRHNTAFLFQAGFKIVNRRQLYSHSQLIEHVQVRVDYERIFEKFKQKMLPFYTQLYAVCFNQADQDPLLPFLRFTQEMPYQLPPDVYQKKFINSFFVPPICLAEGYGDCDSKSVLLADLLASGHAGEKRLGLALIEGNGIAHTVLLAQRPMLPGMSSIYAGELGRYIPLETTAPGWNPGFLSPRLIELLQQGQFFFVPF